MSEHTFDSIAAASRIDTVIRTDRPIAHYEKVFGKDIGKSYGLILDIAAGDSDFADTVNQSAGRTKVIRYDYGYKNDPPNNPGAAAAGFAQKLPFRDGTFNTVVSSFLMEHIPAKDSERSLREMLRVTKDNGDIFIFPVYPHLPNKSKPHSPLTWKNLLKTISPQMTLHIRKNPELTEEEWSNIVSDIAHLPRLPDFAEKVMRIAMKARIAIQGSAKTHKEGKV